MREPGEPRFEQPAGMTDVLAGVGLEAFECEGHGRYVEVYVEGEYVATVSPDSALPAGTLLHRLADWCHVHGGTRLPDAPARCTEHDYVEHCAWGV